MLHHGKTHLAELWWDHRATLSQSVRIRQKLWKKGVGKLPDSTTARQPHLQLLWVLCQWKILNCDFKDPSKKKKKKKFLLFAFQSPGCPGWQRGGHDGTSCPYVRCTASVHNSQLWSWVYFNLQEPHWKIMGYCSNSQVSAGLGNCPQHLQTLHGDTILEPVLPFCTWSPYLAPTGRCHFHCLKCLCVKTGFTLQSNPSTDCKLYFPSENTPTPSLGRISPCTPSHPPPGKTNEWGCGHTP